MKFGTGHFCSGVLISNFTVLTSASCLLKSENEFYKPEELKVAMGSLKKSEKDDTFYTHVKDIKTHGRFNKRTLANNLALLKVFSYYRIENFMNFYSETQIFIDNSLTMFNSA